MSLTRSFPLLLIVTGLLAGCGSDAEPQSEADDLTQAGKKLIGAYVDQGAAPGKLHGLVLTSDAVNGSANRFFADMNTGIVCNTAPCPTIARVEGTFTAGKKTITLKSSDPGPHGKSILGTYDYTLSSAGKLSLKRSGSQQSMARAESYCDLETVVGDCEAQNLPRPKCIGAWTCSEESSCGWDCGAGGGCEGENPAGCSDDSDCGEGEECGPNNTDACIPSACSCSEDAWLCTADCGGGVCVPEGSGGCSGPNPAGCTSDGECGAGEVCGPNNTDACIPSACSCSEDAWICTADCSGGICVAN